MMKKCMIFSLCKIPQFYFAQDLPSLTQQLIPEKADLYLTQIGEVN